MSHGPEYQERRRRQRRQDARLLFYVLRSAITTAALVAIAFAFDIPEKLREKLWGPPPAAVVVQSKPAPKPAQPRRNKVVEPPPESRIDPPRRQFDPVPRPVLTPPPQKDEVIVETPPRQAEPPASAVPTPEPKEEELDSQFVVIALDKQQTRIPLAEIPAAGAPLPRVRVLGLRNIEAKVELERADIAIGKDLPVGFPDHPRARIMVRLDKIGSRAFLVIEPQMALWAEEPLPFMLKRIKSEAFKARRAAAEFNATLAADKARKVALENWLNNARGVPLDEHNQGKAQYSALEASIKEREAKVELVAQGVAEIDALEQLAQLLHGKAELHFALVDSD